MPYVYKKMLHHWENALWYNLSIEVPDHVYVLGLDLYMSHVYRLYLYFINV